MIVSVYEFIYSYTWDIILDSDELGQNKACFVCQTH